MQPTPYRRGFKFRTPYYNRANVHSRFITQLIILEDPALRLHSEPSEDKTVNILRSLLAVRTNSDTNNTCAAL